MEALLTRPSTTITIMAEKVETSSEVLLSPEVVKTEEPSKDESSSENRPSSPEPNCAICLSGPKNKSFTDTCVHQFCFTCLLEWSKVKAECPLCKQTFRCIIHNIRSLDDYDKYQVQPTPPALSPTSFVEGLNQMISDQTGRFRYRTTMVNNHGGVSENLQNLFEALLSSNDYHRPRYDAPGNFVLPTTRRQSARRNAFTGTSDFRRNIYRHNQWVRPAPDISGRYRESSPEFYRLNEAATHRLVPWLNRELNVLLSNNEYQESVMSMILRNITIYPIRSADFLNILTPYLAPHARHFIHEFYSFAISQYDMIGYDSHVQYVSHAELGNDPDTGSYDLSTSSDSDDSDIVLLDEIPRGNNVSNVSNTSVMAVQSPHYSNDGNDSDCMVVEEVTPADRNIELIDVLSDSDDTAQPSTESTRNLDSNIINISNVCASSSDDDFCFIDEFPQVKNTTIPKLKVRDLREIVENPHLPSTSSVNLENQRSSLKLKACTRKARMSSLETSYFDATDSSEEWRPNGSRTKKKKRKRKTKCCCCEKLKKHWKKECLSCYKSDSESQSALDSYQDSSLSDFSEHCKSLQKAFTCQSSHCKSNNGNLKKKSKSVKSCSKSNVSKSFEYEFSSISSADTELSDGCFSANEAALPQRQLRNKTKKSSASVDDHMYSVKKSSCNSKRKQGTSRSSTRKLGKSKGRKHFKSHHSYEPETDSDTEEGKWYSKPKSTRLRINSTESEDKPILKKCKSRGKKIQPPRNSTTPTDDDATPEFAEDLYVPKFEKCPAHLASVESDKESSNSIGRPRLKSVVRVVNSTKRNADSLPHYEIVSSSISEPTPGPSTSRSHDNSSQPSLKTNSKKKA